MDNYSAPQGMPGQPVNPNMYAPVAAPQKNGMGVAGFVLALCAFVFCWVPVLDWILWILGVVFSLIGVFRQPKGLAIAGLVISFIGLIILIVAAAALAAMFL